MKTSEAVIGRWDEVFMHFGLPPISQGVAKHYKGPCPSCGKKNKFRIDNRKGNGDWICTCGYGNGWELLKITTGKDFIELTKEVDAIIGNDSDDFEIMNKINERAQQSNRAIDRFKKMMPMLQSPAHYYLQNRGINIIPRNSIKFSNNEYYAKDNYKQAMVSIVSNDRNEVCYVHCTYLLGAKKDPNAEQNKKMFRIIEYDGSVAIKMFKAKETLGVSEGIETALSTTQLFNVPTWALVNSTMMRKFRAPKVVKTLYIYADNDSNGTGLASAFECGRKNILSNNNVKEVFIVWPDAYDTDFNDYLQGKGNSFLTWKLY